MITASLILFSRFGSPCEVDPDRPTHTRCGVHVSRGRPITVNQAWVWLADSRCQKCHPNWKARQL